MSYEVNRPLQMKLLEIVEMIDKMCHEHGLRYYLVDGSLLGAVRHKGFIPWDDDMDIAMPRGDYEQLINHSSEWLPEGYEFVCFENDDTYPLHFGKIQDVNTTVIEKSYRQYLAGVYVDVFPIDGAPEGKLSQKLYDKKYRRLKKRLYFITRDPYKHGHGPRSWIPLLVKKMYSLKRTQELIKRHMMKYPLETSRIAAVNHNDGLGSMVDKELVLGAPTPIEFEGKVLMGMRDNDAYLSQLFGDYMTPPPPDKIHTHYFFYLDLEHSYLDYDKSKINRTWGK